MHTIYTQKYILLSKVSVVYAMAAVGASAAICHDSRRCRPINCVSDDVVTMV